MAAHEGFLQDICARPHDDVPRLIYADWLEEHGEAPRAEFIRAQIELARPGKPGERELRRGLRRRVKELWKAYGIVWAGRSEGLSYELAAWKRGFCARYAASVDELIAGLPQTLREWPVEILHLVSCRRRDMPVLVRQPELNQIRALSISGYAQERLGDAEVRLLADCPYLARLERLDLALHGVGLEGLRALAHSPHLTALRELKLNDNPLGTDGVHVLAASPLALRLRRLVLGSGHLPELFDVQAARLLATPPAFSRLRSLRLAGTQIGNTGARLLAEAMHLSRLRDLSLPRCEIGNAGVRALANAPHLAGLRRLELPSNTAIGHLGALALMQSPYLKGLRRLYLWDCQGLMQGDRRQLQQHFGRRVVQFE